MTWRPWRRMRDEPDVHDDEPSSQHSEPNEARLARERAEAELIAARSRWPAVHHLAETLRELRQENHFGQRIFGPENRGEPGS